MSEEMRKGEKMLPERALQMPEPLKAGSNDEDALEPELLQALASFKASVQVWSAAAENRAQQNQPGRSIAAVQPARRAAGRLAAGWALASLMAVAVFSGVLYQRHQQQELAQIEHQRVLDQQQLMTAQREQAEEDLLAKVESDISREVPSAMEPLAQLMTSDGTQTANATQ